MVCICFYVEVRVTAFFHQINEVVICYSKDILTISETPQLELDSRTNDAMYLMEDAEHVVLRAVVPAVINTWR